MRATQTPSPRHQRDWKNAKLVSYSPLVTSAKLPVQPACTRCSQQGVGHLKSRSICIPSTHAHIATRRACRDPQIPQNQFCSLEKARRNEPPDSLSPSFGGGVVTLTKSRVGRVTHPRQPSLSFPEKAKNREQTARDRRETRNIRQRSQPLRSTGTFPPEVLIGVNQDGEQGRFLKGVRWCGCRLIA